MTRRRKSTLTFALLAALLISASAHGGVQEFTDKDEWIDAVGEFTTIDFTGFPAGTWITDQYADLGILFTDGDDWIHHTCGFVNDCWGLAGGGGNDQITLAFDTPQAWIAVDFPGGMQIELYDGGRLLYTSEGYCCGKGNFLGLMSSEPFDGAVLIDWVGQTVAIDDLHFGPPAPGTCPWDLDDNDTVGASDLLSLLVTWGPCKGCPADFDGNGSVGASDLLTLLVNWGPCP